MDDITEDNLYEGTGHAPDNFRDPFKKADENNPYVGGLERDPDPLVDRGHVDDPDQTELEQSNLFDGE